MSGCKGLTQKWLTCNFSLLYPYIIKQTGNENTQSNRVEIVSTLSWFNIKLLQLVYMEIFSLEGRIKNQFLGVKGLKDLV